jgi:hypothetical protein
MKETVFREENVLGNNLLTADTNNCPTRQFSGRLIAAADFSVGHASMPKEF